MLMLEMPEEIWQIKLCKMICPENHGTNFCLCSLTRYNPWVKREYLCLNPRRALFVRRSTVDKNGRVYCRHDQPWKCVTKILNNFDKDHQKEMYATSELELMKSLV